MIREINGDLIDLARKGNFDVIVHGCNCFCTMGAGIAKQIRSRFPEAYEADLRTVRGDRRKLGTYSSATVDGVTVVNAYTQFHYRGPGPHADYDAIRSVLAAIAHDFPSSRIGIPQIGAGLAGGDWDTIRSIIEEQMGDSETTVVYYQPQAERNRGPNGLPPVVRG